MLQVGTAGVGQRANKEKTWGLWNSFQITWKARKNMQTKWDSYTESMRHERKIHTTWDTQETYGQIIFSDLLSLSFK